MSAEVLRLKQPKRFRLYFQRSRLFIALPYLILAALFLALRHSLHHQTILGLMYAIAGTLWIVNAFGTWWELRQEGIFERRQWKTRFIPYSDITIVGHVDDVPKAIEIRYASLDPTVFPQGSMPILVSDREGFIESLRALAPNADFRL